MNAPSRIVAPAGFLLILIAVSALNPLAINMFVPSPPGMMASLGTDFATVQLTLSLYLFATAIAQLVLGPLSDRFGRRPVLLVGLGIFLLASIMCTLAPSIEMLLLGRVLQGVGGCAGIVVGRAIIRDRYEREQAATMLAYVTMGYAVAPMVGTVVGGIVDDHLGWRTNFGLILVLAVVATIAAWRSLPETRARADAASIWSTFFGGFGALIRVPAFWAYTLAATFATACFFTFLGGAPYLASRLLGLSGTEFGIYFLFVSASYIVGNFLAARFAARLGLYPMIVAASIVMLVAAAVMAVVVALGHVSVLTVFGPTYVIAFGNGIVLPNSIAGTVSVRPQLAGAASGLGGSLQVGFGGVATVIIGKLLDVTGSALPVPLCVVVLAALTLAAALWIRTARS